MLHVQTTPDLRLLGTILFVGAHPDDETFLAGGILAAAVENGQTVIVATATAGEAGVQDRERWPQATLGATRRHELARALHALGVTKSYTYAVADGRCTAVTPESALAMLRPIVERHRPDTILTFGPDGITGHPDHMAVSAWVGGLLDELPHHPRVLYAVIAQENYASLRQIDERVNLYFNIAEPPVRAAERCAIAVRLPDHIMARKLHALRCMPSQTERIFAAAPLDVLEQAFSCEYFVVAERV